jgi:glyoxylase-like metal-dependent hydrolase (beta-lactamase superfamily II)
MYAISSIAKCKRSDAANETPMNDKQPADDLSHDRTRLPAGVVEQVSPRIRRLISPNPTPFTFTGTCGYIVGKGDVVFIDPGPENPEHVETILAAIKGERLTHILVTHTHRDHSPNARALKAATGAPIFGCARHIEIEHASSGRLDASHDLDHMPDHEMKDGESLRAAGVTLTAVHTPGHASNHLCFSLVEENALFSGDHVMAWSTTIVAPPDGVMRDYMASLDKLRARREAIYFPGHGAPVNEPQRFLRGLVAHRRLRESTILASIGAGDRTVAEIVERVYSGLDEKLKKAASLSTLAHLEDLVARGKIDAGGPATLEATYKPT